MQILKTFMGQNRNNSLISADFVKVLVLFPKVGIDCTILLTKVKRGLYMFSVENL